MGEDVPRVGRIGPCMLRAMEQQRKVGQASSEREVGNN